MTNGNDAAFSRQSFALDADSYDLGASGLTKREYFAAMAMQGLIAESKYDAIKHVVEDSVRFADALITTLNIARCPQCKLPTADNHYDPEHDLCSITERAIADQ